MATERTLDDVLGSDAEAEKTAAANRRKRPASQRSRGSSRTDGASASQPRKRASQDQSGSKPGRRQHPPRDRKQDAQPQPEPPAEHREPVVLTPSASSAKRTQLYLHPDDFRELALAKIDDRADLNARIRAMIALWRSNGRYRAQVDRLARTQPRGPGIGMD
jgi:hypothetical protein